MTSPDGTEHPTPQATASAAGAMIYRCVVRHVRTGPVHNALRHRTYLWLVDLDRLPRLPWPLRPLARFDPRDHFGGTAPDLRTAVHRFLAAHDEPPPSGPIRMLAHARVFGHVFNPLTLFWCHRADGTVRCVVAEVHNTYGERHAYLLHPDPEGRAEADKEFYVSPFNPVEGRYRMRLPAPGERLRLTVVLDRPDAGPLTATVHGRPAGSGPAALVRAAARHPLSTVAVSAAIRLHGVRLALRGLRVRPRPSHPPQKGME